MVNELLIQLQSFDQRFERMVGWQARRDPAATREELERLKLIKRLVDGGRINLAGVQRLLSIADVVQRIRPLMRDETLSPRVARRRLTQELDELSRMLGFE